MSVTLIVRDPLDVASAVAELDGRMVLRTTGDVVGANCPRAAMPMMPAARIATSAARTRIARR